MAEQLIKGNRYFLDGRKDVSGIYEGPDKQGDAQFSGIQGDSPYGKDRKGFVVFQGDKPEITEETEFSEYED